MIAGPVVVGVDFSPALQHAGSWLRCLAPGADVTLVHATERAVIPPFMRALMSEAEYVLGDDAAEERRLGDWASGNGLPDARLVVREGRADVVLLDVGRQMSADLTVVGAHGGHERPWLRLGTVAERLMRAAETSLLVVRGARAAKPRKILVAVDDVAVTPSVLAVAGTLADRFDARLLAVHLETDVPDGVPGDEILHAAERFGADLIVLGRYGVGRALPALLGSVGGSVVHGAECAVLVVAEQPDS